MAKAASLSADDLIRIFNDPEGELQQYKFNPNNVVTKSMEGMFHMELPYDDIKAQVEDMRTDIFSNLDPNAPQPNFEHVGSTSIKGKKIPAAFAK